ncbi:MAG: transcriptional repressor [Bacilli bacterium]|nr:transcriptional repressor [Bacilli bacterium]
MKNYNTKQRHILLDYFSCHIDEVVSTIDIINSLKKYQISESAIYRNLVMLEKERKLRRISKMGDKKTYYQFIDDDNCINQIHITCTKCGSTMHVLSKTSKKLAEKIKEENGFEINNNETVIYGLCSKCSK